VSRDPIRTDPNLYRVVFENERVRVLEYRDVPGDRTHAHAHPDSVMVALASFRRRLHSADRTADVEIVAGTARWIGAQEHAGENIGESPSHALFIELKEHPVERRDTDVPLGPSPE
jgi:beta-alanine degradation protein BauB